MAQPNKLMALWERLESIPGGKFLFSKGVQNKAPYFKTANGQAQVVRPNYCEVLVKKKKSVQNHIGTVHVIAICNGLEMAMGVCAETSIPDKLRWIPKGMRVDYTAKAGSDITCIAEIDPDAWKPGDLEVKVTAKDDQGGVVVKGVILLWISAKKA